MSLFFRRQLRHEIKSWERDGLIDDSQSARLTARYALDALDDEARSTLMNTIFLVGAALIGCGVIAFVAAHWEEISRTLKVIALLLAMLAAHGTGYWFWRVRKEPRPHLGHALTVLGTLIFGANIGLFAQIFHISGDPHQAFLAWAVGALAVAWALQSVPSAVVAVGACFVGFCLYVDSTGQSFFLFPLLAGHLLLPLSYRSKSVFLFFLTLIALTTAIIVNAANLAGGVEWRFTQPFISTFAALWLYGQIHPESGRYPAFGHLARNLGALGVCTMAYILSFHEVVDEAAWAGRDSAALSDGYMRAFLVPLSLAAFQVVVAGFMKPRRLAACVLPLAAGGALSLALFAPEPEIYATIAVNAIALGLGAYGIGKGLRDYVRLPYWAGLLLVVLLITGRFFEYESHLLIKSAAFIGGGVALILAGIKFENRLKSRGAAREEVAHG